MSHEPCGHVCVLRADGLDGWMVSICQGPGTRQELRRFASREEACEFAIAERDRQRAQTGVELSIQMPDDCPCYFDRPVE